MLFWHLKYFVVFWSICIWNTGHQSLEPAETSWLIVRPNGDGIKCKEILLVWPEIRFRLEPCKDPKVSSETNKKRDKGGPFGREESEWCSYTGSTSGLKYISSLPATAAYTAIVEKRRGTGGSDRLRENLRYQKISSSESTKKYPKFCRLETWQTVMYVCTLSHYSI